VKEVGGGGGWRRKGRNKGEKGRVMKHKVK